MTDESAREAFEKIQAIDAAASDAEFARLLGEARQAIDALAEFWTAAHGPHAAIDQAREALAKLERERA